MDEGAPADGRGWADDVRHLLVSGALCVAGWGVLLLTVAAAGSSLVGGLGLPALVGTVRLTRALADVQRRRTGDIVPRRTRPGVRP